MCVRRVSTIHTYVGFELTLFSGLLPKMGWMERERGYKSNTGLVNEIVVMQKLMGISG